MQYWRLLQIRETTHQNRKITFPGVNVLRNTNVNLNSQIKQLTYNMWSIVHLQKLIVAKKLKKSSAFYTIGFEVLIQVNIKTITFWDVMQRNLVHVYRTIRGHILQNNTTPLIPVVTTPHYLSLYWVKLIVPFRLILILSSHLWLGLPSALFYWAVATNSS
jgi:hypothetical protein